MDKRLKDIESWLSSVLEQPLMSIEPASEDASFRRYLRAKTASTSYVVMDAPPEKEPLDKFIRINHALRRQNVHAPEILHQELNMGFLLLEDLGDRTYLDELTIDARPLYTEAIKALITIQRGTLDQADFELPKYDSVLLDQEMDLFDDWYLKRHLDIQLNEQQRLIWQDTKELLVHASLDQPQVWVHRDYHSRNLMITPHDSPAVIDFQDAVIGPLGYDLASLFKDCYIEWPRNDQIAWLQEYQKFTAKLNSDYKVSLKQLIRYFDFCGLQRHLKVLGIFCRLNYRDGKAHYLKDLVLVKKYVAEVIEIYPELENFRTLYKGLPELEAT